MCGIIGIVSTNDVGKDMLTALEKMLYRGVDSSGMAVVSEGKILIRKGVGKVGEVDRAVRLRDLHGRVGIGHNRWATTGKVSQENAHPHTDCQGKIAVVHNGIVENFEELKSQLIRDGHRFASETDTEVIPHLIEQHLQRGFEEAVRKAFLSLRGRNAFVALHIDTPAVIAARKGSPLIVGVGKGEMYIASDITAFLDHTREVMYLDDDEMVVLQEHPVFRSISTGQQVEKRRVVIGWDAQDAEKGDYPHFLLKEIMEQKETIWRAINQKDEDILEIARTINSAPHTYFTGCGTAGKVCRAGEYLFSKIAGKHVDVTVASEFPNFEHLLNDQSLLIAISQSGETADVLEAIERAKKRGTRVLSLVNVEGSSLDRLSDTSVLLKAGPEKAVASTKATTAQLALVTLLAYATAGKLRQGKSLLFDVAGEVNDLLNPRYEERVRSLAKRIYKSPNIFIIGRGANFPIAQEAAIKIMEVSYIHAQGFAGGELKHGPLALITPGTPCIVLVANDELKEGILVNAQEIKARGGLVIGISPQNHSVFDEWIRVPDAGDASPIVNLIPIQLLAYQLGLLRKTDVDMPRNLSKSVTVK
ncbi:MAG: glutamine--fructose-6-phosphate transaminase (isomerizing) [Candidatus Aenigmarchaeota archaeon]|nr:glutamine--fructose-6-phosphate transaminase (isomerizing) [Candidatus Aenigmarchaeota archaeon]